MKRVQYYRYGGPEELRLDEVERPAPGQGQICVRVRAAAANPMDWKIRRGEMRMLSGFRFPRAWAMISPALSKPSGPGVERRKIGDEVLGVTPYKPGGRVRRIRRPQMKNIPRSSRPPSRSSRLPP